MRKRCVSCGFICFVSDETCKKCGSDKLEIVPVDENSPKPVREVKPLGLRHYLLCFGSAIFFEFLSLCPILMFIGTHKGNAELAEPMVMLAFVLNLPGSFISWAVNNNFGVDLILLVPYLQIFLWTWFLIFIARKIHRRSQKLR